jgi:beta-phosphoglucomutase-like phosphatase (HAD superfamily)
MLLDITKNIDVYVFDFDGTLVNSMPDFCQVMIDLIEEYTKDYPKNVLDIIVPLGYKGTIDYFKNVLKINESEEVLMQKLKDGLYKKYSEVICLKQGVYNALKYLSFINYLQFRDNFIISNFHFFKFPNCVKFYYSKS